MQKSFSGCSLMIHIKQIFSATNQNPEWSYSFFNLESEPWSFLPEATVKPEYFLKLSYMLQEYAQVLKVSNDYHQGRASGLKRGKGPLEHVERLKEWKKRH